MPTVIWSISLKLRSYNHIKHRLHLIHYKYSYYRYYSGTGDKSMRGYEFFPRETLQQQINNTHGSSTGAFLQASGEKIYPSPPIDFTGSKASSDFLLTSDLPVPTLPKTYPSQDISSQRIKKRKSRKSLQREKLEQTFKEKGFLIQTQQTESAEGATYCKFRQLRKFTRYLFRSWKDYLPCNIAEGDQPRAIKGENEVSLSELTRDNIDNLSVHSSELSSSTLQQWVPNLLSEGKFIDKVCKIDSL